MNPDGKGGFDPDASLETVSAAVYRDYRPEGVLAVRWHRPRYDALYLGLLSPGHVDGERLGRFYVDGSLLERSRLSWRDRHVPALDWCYAAFAAGEPVEPILDFLVELHADTRLWLAEVVAAVYAGAGA